jgi:hypothetical protein
VDAAEPLTDDGRRLRPRLADIRRQRVALAKLRRQAEREYRREEVDRVVDAVEHTLRQYEGEVAEADAIRRAREQLD